MRIIVGMSGGVDSSVVAALLKSQGHEVIGVTMKTYNPNNPHHEKVMSGTSCYGSNKEKDIQDCIEMCSKLQIPYHVIDVSQEFESIVINNFKSEYSKGRTPNPCVICNRQIKFGILISKIEEMGIEFDYFATGHYARIDRVNGVSYLKKAKDSKKDQSYFLSHLDSKLLDKIMFPLGDYTKEETRQLARDFGLITAEKSDSQDFVSGGYTSLFDSIPGDIVDETGKIVGKHNGITHYTVGQRKGLNISLGKPAFVKTIDSKNNRIVVTTDISNLLCGEIVVSEFSFVSSFLVSSCEKMYIKIRQNHTPVEINNISYVDENKVKISTDELVKSVTPGQAAAIYDSFDRVVAHGVINE